jgi:hypothetical protein
LAWQFFNDLPGFFYYSTKEDGAGQNKAIVPWYPGVAELKPAHRESRAKL